MECFSRFNMEFEEDGEDEEEFGKREGSSKKELTLKLDGKSNEQKARTPRLKHSAIEQRRRSKINDRLLNTLSQSLQNSGIDLSQANISVHINLGRRSGSRHNSSTSIATSKDQDEPSSCNLIIGQARVGNRSDESYQAATKRHK